MPEKWLLPSVGKWFKSLLFGLTIGIFLKYGSNCREFSERFATTVLVSLSYEFQNYGYPGKICI